MASLDGFQGHFDMLYDDERNQAYAEAIRRAAERAPSGGATALDIGSGSGLLGLLCWQTGRFHRVVLLEACPPLATAAKENIQRNGAASCCTVWEGHSNDVLHQTEAAGSQPFDLCVSELLDSVLIGEGVLDSLRHAWASPYFGPGTTLIPQRATVFGRLFWSPALFAQHRGSAIWNLPEDMQVCPGLHAAEHLHLRPFLQAGLLSFVSEAFEVFDFDFSAPCLSRRRRCAVPITVAFPEALEAHGVALWFDAQLFEDVTLSTSVEGGSGAPREHWRQAALCFRSPLKLESRLELEWHHDEDAIWVTLPRNAEKSYAGKPPMCRCGLHAGTARRRLGMTDWHMEIMEIPPGCRAAALVFGDGPQLPLLLAERGYSPVISVGRGLLNATLVQKFARHHQRSEIRVALKTGELVPLLDTAQVQGRKRPAGAMKADNETDSEDAAFDFLMLAQNLLQDYPAEHWSAFTEAWYEELSEDWAFPHLLQAAHDASELKTALEMAGYEASMVEASPALCLKCCAFDSEWLDRRLRPLPEDSTPWRGLDLRALNQLHAGQRSVDLWPLLSLQLLVVSSPQRELGRFSLFQQQEEDDCQFCPEFSESLLLERLSHVPEDWQIVYLGGQDLLRRQHLYEVGKGVRRLYKGFRETTAYVINDAGAKACLEVSVPLHWQIDTHMNDESLREGLKPPRPGHQDHTMHPRGYFLWPGIVAQQREGFPTDVQKMEHD